MHPRREAGPPARCSSSRANDLSPTTTSPGSGSRRASLSIAARAGATVPSKPQGSA